MCDVSFLFCRTSREGAVSNYFTPETPASSLLLFFLLFLSFFICSRRATVSCKRGTKGDDRTARVERRSRKSEAKEEERKIGERREDGETGEGCSARGGKVFLARTGERKREAEYTSPSRFVLPFLFSRIHTGCTHIDDEKQKKRRRSEEGGRHCVDGFVEIETSTGMQTHFVTARKKIT